MALLFLVAVFVLYILFIFRRSFIELWKLNRICSVNLEKIPGPPCLPIIGAAHQFKWNNVDFTHQLEDWGRKYLLCKDNYFGMLKIWVGPVPLVFCGTHESIKVDTPAYQTDDLETFVMRNDHRAFLKTASDALHRSLNTTHYCAMECAIYNTDALNSSVSPILESNTNITKPNQYDIISDWIGTGLLTRARRADSENIRNHVEKIALEGLMTKGTKGCASEVSASSVEKISTNEKWLQRRKLLTPTFHFNVLQNYQKIFAKQGKLLVDLVAKEDGFFDFFPYIKRCALDIICETAMGTAIHSQTGGNDEYVKAVHKLGAVIWIYERFPWLWFKPIWYLTGYGYEFDRLVKLTNDFTRKVIADRKRAMEEDGTIEGNGVDMRKDRLAFLDLLLRMQHSSQLSDEDIREEVDTFMFEGHDTTSSGIGFTVWWLGQTPECQRKVHEELDAVFGDSDRSPTSEDLKQLVYLEKCIKESLRLTPSVPLIARKLSQDVVIGETTLPEGLTVVVVPVTTSRDPRYWEHPEEFYPEHFDTDKVIGRHPYAYIPFSAGPRNCIGQKFALLEEKAVLSWIFRRYHVETEEPFPGNRPIPELILKPSNGIRVRLTKR